MKAMKEYRLLSKMAEGYHAGNGVDTMTLCQITPAYSQRFGEWRQKGIQVDKHKNDDGTYTYYLRTDPRMIDWREFKLIYNPDLPAKPRGIKQNPVANQVGMEF